jgi:hypothetical protein
MKELNVMEPVKGGCHPCKITDGNPNRPLRGLRNVAQAGALAVALENVLMNTRSLTGALSCKQTQNASLGLWCGLIVTRLFTCPIWSALRPP